MPRKSKRAEILRAAYAIVAGPGGIEAVTYDRLAAETDLSKSGLLYHFPSRHELLVGLHEYTAGLWEDKVRARAGGDAADLAPRERYRAMLVTRSSASTSRSPSSWSPSTPTPIPTTRARGWRWRTGGCRAPTTRPRTRTSWRRRCWRRGSGRTTTSTRGRWRRGTGR